ncbi:MAG TPA: hypothetical protein VF210_13090 [Pseudomonadales bacterium]
MTDTRPEAGTRPLRRRFRFAAALGSLAVIATVALASRNPPPPLPEVSLGVMKSCAHIGELAERIALDRDRGVTVDAERYRHYREYLTRRRALVSSPDFALLLAFGSEALEPATIRNLGVQTCVAAYYGFRGLEHHESLYDAAVACQQRAGPEPDEAALADCMGRRYRRLLARWWRDAEHPEGAASGRERLSPAFAAGRRSHSQ